MNAKNPISASVFHGIYYKNSAWKEKPFIMYFRPGEARGHLNLRVPKEIYNNPERFIDRFGFSFLSFSYTKKEQCQSFFSDLNKTIKNYQKRTGVKLPQELKNINQESIRRYIPDYGNYKYEKRMNLSAIEQFISSTLILFKGLE